MPIYNPSHWRRSSPTEIEPLLPVTTVRSLLAALSENSELIDPLDGTGGLYFRPKPEDPGKWELCVMFPDGVLQILTSN